jgi:DNA-binding XRE family transcriptional regulator
MYSGLYTNAEARFLSEEHRYIVDRYAQSLTKYEVKTLFERLRERKGSLAAATKDIEITRKTVYDWESSSDDVKMSTKRKVLEAILEIDFSGTIDFLVKKTALNYREILERHVNMSLNKILSTENSEDFQQNISLFERTLKSHIGALFDIKTVHIEEMTDLINQKAQSLGATEIPRDIDLMSPQLLSQKSIQLIEVLSMKTMFKNEIASKLGLPKEFVDRACLAASYINPPSELQEIPRFTNRVMDDTKIMDVSLKYGQFEHAFARKEYVRS